MKKLSFKNFVFALVGLGVVWAMAFTLTDAMVIRVLTPTWETRIMEFKNTILKVVRRGINNEIMESEVKFSSNCQLVNEVIDCMQKKCNNSKYDLNKSGKINSTDVNIASKICKGQCSGTNPNSNWWKWVKILKNSPTIDNPMWEYSASSNINKQGCFWTCDSEYVLTGDNTCRTWASATNTNTNTCGWKMPTWNGYIFWAGTYEGKYSQTWTYTWNYDAVKSWRTCLYTCDIYNGYVLSGATQECEPITYSCGWKRPTSKGYKFWNDKYMSGYNITWWTYTDSQTPGACQYTCDQSNFYKRIGDSCVDYTCPTSKEIENLIIEEEYNNAYDLNWDWEIDGIDIQTALNICNKPKYCPDAFQIELHIFGKSFDNFSISISSYYDYNWDKKKDVADIRAAINTCNHCPATEKIKEIISKWWYNRAYDLDGNKKINEKDLEKVEQMCKCVLKVDVEDNIGEKNNSKYDLNGDWEVNIGDADKAITLCDNGIYFIEDFQELVTKRNRVACSAISEIQRLIMRWWYDNVYDYNDDWAINGADIVVANNKCSSKCQWTSPTWEHVVYWSSQSSQHNRTYAERNYVNSYYCLRSCEEGYILSGGNICRTWQVAATNTSTTKSCGWTKPTWDGYEFWADEYVSGQNSQTSWTYVDSLTGACQYTCDVNHGYAWNSETKKCELQYYDCGWTKPTRNGYIFWDDKYSYGQNITTSWKHVSSNPKACEYTCDIKSSYWWNGTTCSLFNNISVMNGSVGGSGSVQCWGDINTCSPWAVPVPKYDNWGMYWWECRYWDARAIWCERKV